MSAATSVKGEEMAEGGTMRAYHCRKCHRWLFDSDAEWGQVRQRCPSRDCRELQTIYLGGRRREWDPPVPPDPNGPPGMRRSACQTLSVGV